MWCSLGSPLLKAYIRISMKIEVWIRIAILSRSLADCPAPSFYGRVWVLGYQYWLGQVDGSVVQLGCQAEKDQRSSITVSMGLNLPWSFQIPQLPRAGERGRRSKTMASSGLSQQELAGDKLEKPFFAHKPCHVVLLTGGGENHWI